MGDEQIKRLRAIEEENPRQKMALADLAMDSQIIEECSRVKTAPASIERA
ncbi:MAG: hypothetical protein JJU33_13955 [Phycisphaerales bacterium]|nr:hypothetical protein [Phycisphaerales bacterium]